LCHRLADELLARVDVDVLALEDRVVDARDGRPIGPRLLGLRLDRREGDGIVPGEGIEVQAVSRVASYQRFSRLAALAVKYRSMAGGRLLPKVSGSGNQTVPPSSALSISAATAGDQSTAVSDSSSGVGPPGACWPTPV
jgi:hypothetical protein